MELTMFKIVLSLQFDLDLPVIGSVLVTEIADRPIDAAWTFRHLVVHCRDLGIGDSTLLGCFVFRCSNLNTLKQTFWSFSFLTCWEQGVLKVSNGTIQEDRVSK